MRISLARNGVEVVIMARTAETLEATAEEIRRETGAKVTAIAGDITTPGQGSRAGKPALNLTSWSTTLGSASGGFPRLDRASDRIRALDANMLTPIELIKATVDGMMSREFGRIVNITSSAVKAPIDILGLSNGAR